MPIVPSRSMIIHMKDKLLVQDYHTTVIHLRVTGSQVDDRAAELGPNSPIVDI